MQRPYPAPCELLLSVYSSQFHSISFHFTLLYLTRYFSCSQVAESTKVDLAWEAELERLASTEAVPTHSLISLLVIMELDWSQLDFQTGTGILREMLAPPAEGPRAGRQRTGCAAQTRGRTGGALGWRYDQAAVPPAAGGGQKRGLRGRHRRGRRWLLSNNRLGRTI